MESSEEKFFESLAKGGTESEQLEPLEPEFSAGGGEVELVKAATTQARPKTATKKAEKEFESDLEGQLTIDVYQTPEDIVIESAIAGVKPDDLDISVSNDAVTIRGRRHHESEVRDEDYFYQECYWGKFSRSVILPQEIDPEGATVSFKNGILVVRLPKINRKKTKKLKVRIE